MPHDHFAELVVVVSIIITAEDSVTDNTNEWDLSEFSGLSTEQEHSDPISEKVVSGDDSDSDFRGVAQPVEEGVRCPGGA